MEAVPVSNLEVLEFQQQHTQNDPQQWLDIKPPKTELDQLHLDLNNGPARRERSWIPIAVFAVVLTTSIVGAAVGGGLGASLSTCQSNLSQCREVTRITQNLPSTTSNTLPMATSLPSSTTSSSSTAAVFPTNAAGLFVNYTVEPSTKIHDLAVDCANLTSTYQMSLDQEKYSVYCQQDFGTGNLKDGNNKDVLVANVLSVIAYSMADCLQACSQYTYWSKQAGISTSCGAVLWTSDMTSDGHSTGNCYLKNSTIMFGIGNKGCGWCYSATKIL